MTEEQYNYYCGKVAIANECKTEIRNAERVLRCIELGDRIGIHIGSEQIQHHLSLDEITKIKAVIVEHYQKELDEYNNKLKEL